MKYLKNAYYMNSHFKNGGDPLGVNFDVFVEFLVRKEANNIFEVGFEFGHRLNELEQNGLKISGGIEFDPNFGLYRKWNNIFERDWDIRFSNIEFFDPKYREVVITNNFFNYIEPEHRDFILHVLKGKTKYLYLNEEVELSLEKDEDFYVNVNERWDDIKGDSRDNNELPSFESLRNRFNESESVSEEVNETQTGEDD